jgi:hypothetical protein
MVGDCLGGGGVVLARVSEVPHFRVVHESLVCLFRFFSSDFSPCEDSIDFWFSLLRRR